MSSSTTTPISNITQHFNPIIYTFSTPDLIPILSRSNLNSISNLLLPFESNIERVNVRSSTFESRLLLNFPVKFIERSLPIGFDNAIGEGSVMNHHNRRSSTTTGQSPLMGNSNLPHFPSATEPSPPSIPITELNQSPTLIPLDHHRVSISFSQPTQIERDELFLDSLSSSISQKAEGWISNQNRKQEELKVRVKTRINKRKDEDISEKELIDEGWENRRIEELTPWYTTMRDEIFKRREMVEWETFAWPVGTLLAISTSHSDPLGALSALWDLTSKEKLFSPTSYPPNSGAEEDGRKDWANPDVLRYIVLVHDFGAGGGREGWEDAQVLHELIRKTYGIHTALLPIFSASPTAANPQPKAQGLNLLWSQSTLPSPTSISFPPNSTNDNSIPHTSNVPMERGQELSEEDLKALRMFLREMVVQSLIPFIERSVVVGNEQWNSSKRSIGGRLFSAGRKYFGGSNTSSRAGSPVSTTTTPTGFNSLKGCYPFTAQESQTRRLADLAFMIGDYKLALNVYEQASKDFKTDKAWKYYSSAARMTGLTQLLLHPLSTPLNFNPDLWLEQATQVPPGMIGGVDLDGLKAIMLYYEAYRAIGDYRPAPEGLVRTAGEVDEISSALLLEQAAISDLHLPRPSKRKYAFHMAMAAKRYEKTGLKSLSRRCLSQAASVYYLNPSTSIGWDAIRSHLYYGLGRQAYNVGKPEEAVEHFLELLVGGVNGHAGAGEEFINHGGEESWLDDFGLAWEHLSGDTERVVKERNLKLHATIFNPKDVFVRVIQNGIISTTEAEGIEWEELASTFSVPTIGSNSTRKVKVTNNDVINQALVGETFYLELKAQNPLDAPLAIGGIRIETDAEDGILEIDAPQEVELAPREALRIYIPIRAKSLLTFKFTQISFRFNDLLPCTETLTRKPKRLNSTREQLVTPTYGEDNSLSVTVRSPIPILSISLEELPNTLYAGEAQLSFLTLTNTGQAPLLNLRAICSHPSFILFQQTNSSNLYINSVPNAFNTFSSPNNLIPNIPFDIPLDSTDSSMNNSSLEPGLSIKVPILCRGDGVGQHSLRWLFAFTGSDDPEILTARTLHELEVKPSIEIRPKVRPSNSPSTPFLISLESFNVALPSDVVITQISSISPQWKCKMLEGSNLSNDISPIAFQQSAILYLAIEPIPILENVKVVNNKLEFAAKKLDSLLQGRDVKNSKPEEIILHQSSISSSQESVDVSSLALYSSILQTHIRLRHISLTYQLPTIDSSLHQYLFPLFNPRSIDLLVFWSSPSKNLRGHHHLAGIPLGAGKNILKTVLETAELKAGGLYAESQRERSTLLAGLRRSEFGIDENPAGIIFEVDEIVNHDFTLGPCSVTLTFYIRNCSTTSSFDYNLSLQASNSNAIPNPLTYSGILNHRGSVLPLSIVKVKTKAWVQRHGMYEAGDWKFKVTGTEGQSWVQVGTSRQIRFNDVGSKFFEE